MPNGSIKYRLRNDFQLAVITLMAAVALLGITPFTLMRASNGEWLQFGLDLLLEGGIVTGVIYAWKTGRTRGPSLFLAYLIGAMAVFAVYKLGVPGQNWFYTAIVASFFLIDRRHAMAIALIGLLALLLGGAVGGSTAEASSFYVTIIVCALLSYVFAYRTARQRHDLETLATRDPLTGVHNRRTLVDDLERVRQVFRREQRRYAILVLDLDSFKSINDRHGHLAGDHVLMALARLIENSIRKSDRLYRYGGEEFVIVVPAANQNGLATMAEKLRRTVAANLAAPDGKPITTSIGGAILRKDESVADWFARADTMLYVAKNSGRNRAIIDPDDPTATNAVAPPPVAG
jgi:diguanylate cyclase (GGDEF)-like protein